MAKNLLVLTTAARFKWLQEAIATLRDPLDVLVIDDATPNKVGMRSFCRAKGIEFLTKSKPKGLTDSWNLAYQFFQKGNYGNCILSNDDVRFPKGFSTELLRGLQFFNLTVPLSNRPGHQRLQKLPSSLLSKATSKNLDEIQKGLRLIYRDAPFKQPPFFNGFCFAFARTIKKFAFSNTLLFNPRFINVGNEDDLNGRIQRGGGKISVCRLSYVFHWKGVTLKGRGWNRERLWRKP